jgi:hypothetical protein
LHDHPGDGRKQIDQPASTSRLIAAMLVQPVSATATRI